MDLDSRFHCAHIWTQTVHSAQFTLQCCLCNCFTNKCQLMTLWSISFSQQQAVEGLFWIIKNGVWVVFACFFCRISWGYKYLLLMNEWSCAARQSPDWSYCLESWSKLITVRCFVIGLERLCKDASRLREIQLAAAKSKSWLVFPAIHTASLAFWWKGACAKLVGVVQWGCHWCDFIFFSA